jgi:4-hydroxy-3-polyprenylbenzoate decarboxylase
MSGRKIAIAVTGASGAIYAKILFEKLAELKSQISQVAVVMSDNAKIVWKYELGNEDYQQYDFNYYDKHDFMSPIASGSSRYDTMIICPCSAGTLGRIASGVSNDLTTRAADVMLKERRKLILLLRETPLNLIQINNMKTVTEAGAIVCPATPSFYSLPKTVEEVAGTVINRVIDLAGLNNDSYRWGDS